MATHVMLLSANDDVTCGWVVSDAAELLGVPPDLKLLRHPVVPHSHGAISRAGHQVAVLGDDHHIRD